jgi:hypothetical protein
MLNAINRRPRPIFLRLLSATLAAMVFFSGNAAGAVLCVSPDGEYRIEVKGEESDCAPACGPEEGESALSQPDCTDSQSADAAPNDKECRDILLPHLEEALTASPPKSGNAVGQAAQRTDFLPFQQRNFRAIASRHAGAAALGVLPHSLSITTQSTDILQR